MGSMRRGQGRRGKNSLEPWLDGCPILSFTLKMSQNCSHYYGSFWAPPPLPQRTLIGVACVPFRLKLLKVGMALDHTWILRDPKSEYSSSRSVFLRISSSWLLFNASWSGQSEFCQCYQFSAASSKSCAHGMVLAGVGNLSVCVFLCVCLSQIRKKGLYCTCST